MTKAYSEFDRMKDRLRDWGTNGWVHLSRCLHPDDGCLVEISAIYELGRADRQGEGEDDFAPEIPHHIDVRDCEYLDILIMELGKEHREDICHYFYKRRRISRERVDEAVRALMDRDDIAQGRDRRVA